MLVSATLFSAFGFLVSAETRRMRTIHVAGLLLAIVGIWAASGAAFSALAVCLAEFLLFAQLGLFFGFMNKENAIGYLVKRTFRLA